MKLALELTHASFGYGGHTRLQDVSLTAPEGSAIALIGPNGSGKSTLMNGLLGLATHTGGQVRVLETTPERARGHIAFLPQTDTRDTTLPLTLRHVVTMGVYRQLGPLQPVGATGRRTVDEMLERVGLSNVASEPFGALSGGQQQRGILARALVSRPRLLLLDEPFNGLDRENRETLLQLVRELTGEGRTVLVSTHDLEIARAACTHVLVLAAGHQPGQPGHPAAFGRLPEALTQEAVRHAFEDTHHRSHPHQHPCDTVTQFHASPTVFKEHTPASNDQASP